MATFKQHFSDDQTHQYMQLNFLRKQKFQRSLLYKVLGCRLDEKRFQMNKENKTPQELPQQLLRRPPAMNSSIPQLPEDEDVNWSSEKFDRFSTMHE
ncbi:unnamed protein product [Enterobius vermicularis]|uniref:Uncharacterized protein n=1 Tax=Enterobius vermicularis TaxID=51028 RepID=A0A0N4UT74_ENTVE|nr:unnamed protein product [Enterobius vermicularis]